MLSLGSYMCLLLLPVVLSPHRPPFLFLSFGFYLLVAYDPHILAHHVEIAHSLGQGPWVKAWLIDTNSFATDFSKTKVSPHVFIVAYA